MNSALGLLVFLVGCLAGFFAYVRWEENRACWVCHNQWRVRGDGLCATCGGQLTAEVPAYLREQSL